jgi:exopolysaccharide biosynthesis WecB/TagA/CpsF family protein
VTDIRKANILGVLVSEVSYDTAVDQILKAAKDERGFSVTALAVHGVMTGAKDKTHRYRLNHLDLVTPDGQPVRWALNLLHGSKLKDRVYGPNLMLQLCSEAARNGIPIYLYGSREIVLSKLSANLRGRFPGLIVAGAAPSRFGRVTPVEKTEIAQGIKDSGAKLVFVGLGCPRQEVFAYEFRDELSMPVIAVGAAFDYHSGLASEPSEWVQRHGLQWLHRLVRDPKRLWKRYLLLNTSYVARVAMQGLHLSHPEPLEVKAPDGDVLYA